MAIKTFGQLRQEIGENISILDANQVEAFDATTSPTLTRVNQYINDGLREITSNFPYDSTERSCVIPFFHRINDVPSANLIDASGISGTIVPFPNTDSLETMCVQLEPDFNFSGISFVNTSGDTVTSVSGSQSTQDLDRVGYMYEMPADVDKLIAVTIPQNGIKLQFTPYYDFLRQIPQGLANVSGTTPAWYTIQNGLSSSGNQMIQMYPFPDQSLSGTTFQIHYQMKQTDLTLDTDQQQVIPDNFQDIIVHAALEKSYALVSDMEKSAYHGAIKYKRLMEFRKWCENNPDFVNRYRDGHYLSSSTFSVGVDLAVGYMINGFGQ